VSNLAAKYVADCHALVKNSENLGESQRLTRLFELEWDYQMIENPIFATYNGYPGQNHRWPDVSPAEISRRKQDWKHWHRTLTSIDRSQLNIQDALSYDLFEYYLNDEIEGAAYPEELRVISQMHGPQQTIPFVLGLMPVFKLSDCEDMLARLRAVPAYIDQNIDLMAEGLRKGVTPPQLVQQDVAQLIANQIPDKPEDAPVLDAFKKLPSSFTDSQQKEMRAEATSIFAEFVAPAFKKLHAYFVELYLPRCRQPIAFRDLPDGESWYRYLVRSFTTSDMTPDEVFETGHSEVARIREEMDEAIRSSGFEGNFDAFTHFLRTDPQFYHDKAEDLVREYRDISKRADPELARLFGKLPSLPYGVIPIPAYSEKSQTTAYYQPGSLQAGRPGYYYVNTYDLKSRPRWEMEPLTLHEAVPGHHLQISLAQELEGLPEFRKKGWITAYGEGWALYAESLGKEMGFYTSPYSRFGQLTYEMWRAVRLVVDVGMHWKGWSRQQAIDFIIENSGKTEHDVRVEVDRYIVWPGQALAYKIGELKIKQLRKYAEDSLGTKMSLRDFHDEILCHGSMPLNLLEQHIKNWVAAGQGSGCDSARPTRKTT
jgi:uncharacterized protein (DUF885 family)